MQLPPRVSRHLDVALAATAAVASVVQVVLDPLAPLPIGVVFAVASSIPLAFRRTRPLGAALFAALVWLIPTDGFLYLGFVIAFVLFYGVGAYGNDRQRVVLVVAAGVVLATASIALRGEAPGELFAALSFVVAPALVGRVVRRQRDQARRLEVLTERLEREQERNALAAVNEERTRIAREVHDTVAHAISVIAVQADAAEAALERDPELARRPVRTIRRSSTDALAEMRRLLEVLRTPSSTSEIAPQPNLAQLPVLVESARDAGLEVEVRLTGEPQPVPPSVGGSAYRILQEALTNVGKHAAGEAVTVTVDWRPDELRLEVEDDGAGSNGAAGGGHGLIGMRERTRLHNGTFEAGPAAGGGWRVSASLPFGAPQ